MKAYIHKHIKLILIVTASLIIIGLAIASPVIIAKMQPVLSESLNVVQCELKETVYEYTGKEIQPKISKITFEDKEQQKVVKKKADFHIVKYIDNVKVGQAGVKIALEGYQGTLVIENVFQIKPASAKGLKIASSTKEMIELSWDKTIDVDGYLLYKSADNGQNYVQIADVKADNALNYQDKDIQCNAVYMYYVCAYVQIKEELVLGDASDTVKCYTSLENPVISSVTRTSYNTLQVQWPVVAGAAGYQVYKSDTQDGEYQCIAEITDGTVGTYVDSSCECAKTYYYYIKVCQKTEFETRYGEASPVVSGKTTPNRVSLSGSSKEGNTKVVLSWKKTNGAQGYEVYKNGKHVYTLENADSLSWSDSGLSKEAEASYKVRAYCLKNGSKIYGSFSVIYEKEVTINYDYSAVSSDVSVLTQYVGRSYVFGGTSPTKGWDCSGFTQYVFKKHFGISLPRTSGEQAGRGKSVSKNNRSEWKPGDLLFYKENGRISHVAIYLGNGQMIHALNSKYDTLIQGVDYYESWDRKTSLYCVKRIF